MYRSANKRWTHPRRICYQGSCASDNSREPASEDSRASSAVTKGCFRAPALILFGLAAAFPCRKQESGSWQVTRTILQLKYSQMLRSAPLIRTSSYALAICLVYSGCFLFYTPSGKRNDFWKLVMRTTLLAGCALLYAGFENPGLVKDRFGLLVTVLTLSYIGLPLLKLREVVRNKSSEGLPLPVILASTGASVLWLLYGIILHNYFIIVQKVIALGLCAVQLSLFVIYPAPAATAAAVRAQHKKPKGE